jgi:uncharacterized protein (TIGR02453 family)
MVRRREAPMAAEHPFEGFADAKFDFFRRLAKHQDRAWFHEHKAEYVEGWHQPMEALLAAVRAKVDADFPYCELAEPKVFRIQRDTRFAKDKTPYKTTVAGVISVKGAGGVMETPAALYVGFGLGDDANMTGHGAWMMTPAQVERYRAAVVDERRGAELAREVAALRKAGFTLSAMETLKKAPRGFDPDHPRAELLRMKGLAAMGPPVPAALLTSPKLVEHLAKQTRRTAALVQWLVETTAV